MTHENAYGQRGGVDPFTGSATSFDRGSGDNAYTITVENTAGEGLTAGATLVCEPGSWVRDESTFEYRWLRDGVAIPLAESFEYTLTAADEGNVVQCEVRGANASFLTSATTTALTISPAPATPAPVLDGEVNVPEESATVAVGATQTCTPGSWSESPSFSYRWLRNGTPIAGATSTSYTPVAADAGTGLQCQVTATNAGGSVVADNVYPVVVEPPPGEESEYPAHPDDEPAEGRPGPTLPSTTETSGPVTVADELPAGLVLAPPVGGIEGTRVSGQGWACAAPTVTAFTCTRSDGLKPQRSYPPITAIVHANSGAPSSVVNSASVGGGGASVAATASDPTAIATVPFGIASFTTSVTAESGAPFTQAGGHPFAAASTFVLNYVPSDEAGYLMTAGGATLKDAQAELPPGFVGDPQNAERCATPQHLNSCPAGSIVGYADVALHGAAILAGHAQPSNAPNVSPVWSLAPQPGHAAEFGFVVVGGLPFVLEAKLRSDGDYGITIGDEYAGRNGPAPLGVSLTLCENGVTGSEPNFTCARTPQPGFTGPFLTTPTRCSGPAPVTTLRVDSYEHPDEYFTKPVYNGAGLVEGAPNLSESFATGCDLLHFHPEADFAPSASSEGGTTQADEPTGATFALKVPQTDEAGVNATPELKDATVTLPAGMTVDPSAADGLRACSDAQFGLGSSAEPTEPAACPPESQIGTVKVVTPLLEKPLEGQVFVGEPECSPCGNADAEAGRVFRLFLQARSPERGVVVKLAGHVSANPATGQLQATFTQQPQLPFSELLLTFTGGPRAPLANPQTCGTYTTTTDLTPWSAPGVGGLSGEEAIAGTPDATPSSSFAVDWNGAGGACPASLPFSPSLSAGSQAPVAGASSPFTVTIGREDREQDISTVTVTTPPGMLGDVAQVPRCPEAQANAGTCGGESQIGTTTVGAGPGPHPFYLDGRVYLTGPYKGDPFGLSIVVPAIAGPFDLGDVVVRAAIAVNSATGALSIASDPLPQYLAGVQLRLRKIEVEVNRSGFMLNPTSCAPQSVGATIAAAQGASATVSAPFEVGGCPNLPFTPSLSATTQGRASKAGGASLNVTVRSAPGQANIAKVDLELPKQLPARLTTLQKACTEAQFDADPAGCPAASVIGTARAITPILNAPLTGPAYLVSHGGAAFPDVEFVLQGEGVEIVLDGHTDIKDGITYSRFETVPDAPVSLFETTLPEGPHSILGTDLPASAKYNLCSQSLSMGTIITAQNGKQIKQNTKVAVTGCEASKPLTRAQKLAKALKACRRHKQKRDRGACERRARWKYGPRAKGRTLNKQSLNGRGKR